MLATAHGHGRSLTLRPQRANALFSWVCVGVGDLGRRLHLPVAASPDPAAGQAEERGTSVSAESMVTATTIAEAAPSAPTNGTSET